MMLQPIETAPKDGKPILLYFSNPIDHWEVLGWSPSDIHFVVGWYDPDMWGQSNWSSNLLREGSADTDGHSSPIPLEISPTHWMPLPEPPK